MQRALKLTEEAGEVSAEVLKLTDYKGTDETPSQIRGNIKEEAIDALICVLDMNMSKEEVEYIMDMKLEKWKKKHLKMATLETQYKNHLADNPESKLSFEEWRIKQGEWLSESIKRLKEKEMFEKSFSRPSNYFKLSPERQWEIDDDLGILDWEGGHLTEEEQARFKAHYKQKPSNPK